MLLLAKTQPPILYVRTIYDHPRYVDRLFRDWYDITQLPKDGLKVTVNFNYCKFLAHIGVAFSGTLVNIAFRCDESYYCLASEVPQLRKRIF